MPITKILIVDDEVELEHLFRQRLRKYLRAGEFELVFAHTGREALEKLQNDRQIRLVLTDLNMPEMDGFTLLKQLSQLQPSLKTVVTSAYSDVQNTTNAISCGAIDFLPKPMNFEKLLETIRATLRGH